VAKQLCTRYSDQLCWMHRQCGPHPSGYVDVPITFYSRVPLIVTAIEFLLPLYIRSSCSSSSKVASSAFTKLDRRKEVKKDSAGAKEKERLDSSLKDSSGLNGSGGLRDSAGVSEGTQAVF
jgi:hypothetical protein